MPINYPELAKKYGGKLLSSALPQSPNTGIDFTGIAKKYGGKLLNVVKDVITTSPIQAFAKRIAPTIGKALIVPPSPELQQTFSEALGKTSIPSTPESRQQLSKTLAIGATSAVGLAEPIKEFKGLKNLSTKLLEKFRGMPDEITPQQFNEIINKAQKEGIKKADLDMVREAAERQMGKVDDSISKAEASGQSFDAELTWARGTRAAGIQNAGLKNYNQATKVLENAGELPKAIKTDKVTKDYIKNYYETKKPPVAGDTFTNAKGEIIEITKVESSSINYFLKGKNKGIEGKVYTDKGFLTNQKLVDTSTKTPELISSIKTAKQQGQSFDEWVKGQETNQVFRGERTGKGMGKGGAVMGKGLYVSPKRETALYYADNVAENIKGYEVIGKPKLLEKDSVEFGAIHDKAMVKAKRTDWDYERVIGEDVQKAGYDGVKDSAGGKIVIFKPEKFLKEAKTRSQLKAEWDKAQGGKISLPTVDLDLMREAVEMQMGKAERVYHGTEATFDKIDLTKSGSGTGRGVVGDAFYTSTNKETASNFGKNIKSFEISSDTKILKDRPILSIEQEIYAKDKSQGWPIKPNRIKEYLQKQGYDGIQYKDGKDLEIAIFNPNKLIPSKSTISLSTLAKDVEEKLVPLTATPVKSVRYFNEQTSKYVGNPAGYGEIVYQSPIKTSVGDVHYPSRSLYLADNLKHGGENFPNYFSHVRYEDLADGKTRKILETQSDLMQKENFAREFAPPENYRNLGKQEFQDIRNQRAQELSKLQPYYSNDPLAHLRTFREEVKRAAKDGKDTLLVPTGRTALDIEGLGQQDIWKLDNKINAGFEELSIKLTPENIKVGQQILNSGDDAWIITDILTDGRFKAVPKERWDSLHGLPYSEFKIKKELESVTETFDISGKVDTKHFVYKLNEEAILKEARKQGLIVEGKVKQDNGEWWRIKIPKERARMPVEAFGVLPFLPIRRKEQEE